MTMTVEDVRGSIITKNGNREEKIAGPGTIIQVAICFAPAPLAFLARYSPIIFHTIVFHPGELSVGYGFGFNMSINPACFFLERQWILHYTPWSFICSFLSNFYSSGLLVDRNSWNFPSFVYCETTDMSDSMCHPLLNNNKLLFELREETSLYRILLSNST